MISKTRRFLRENTKCKSDKELLVSIYGRRRKMSMSQSLDSEYVNLDGKRDFAVVPELRLHSQDYPGCVVELSVITREKERGGERKGLEKIQHTVLFALKLGEGTGLWRNSIFGSRKGQGNRIFPRAPSKPSAF